ncbi:DNA polymerase III subunit epsilon [Buchnera aphidicola]|nr:DNA polymerase III subunit epsilon [Buchnera aphidicola]
MNRKISIDIETTGMNDSGLLYKNHKIIEIGAIEIINRKITKNFFHVYLNPEREIDIEAFKVHGITKKFLINKPKFSDIYDNFIQYIKNSEIIVHNEEFDISFLNYEIKKLNNKFYTINKYCKIIDTLKIARKIFPGKKNNLDILCSRYKINTINRKLHSAIIDANLLAKLYLRMTSFQKKIKFNNFIDQDNKCNIYKNKLNNSLRVLKASDFENQKHLKYLKNMEKNNNCLWMN